MTSHLQQVGLLLGGLLMGTQHAALQSLKGTPVQQPVLRLVCCMLAALQTVRDIMRYPCHHKSWVCSNKCLCDYSATYGSCGLCMHDAGTWRKRRCCRILLSRGCSVQAWH